MTDIQQTTAQQPAPDPAIGGPGTPLIPGTATDTTRPGGPPARTLESDRIAQLEASLVQLQQAQSTTVQEAMGAKETKRDAETRISELEAKIADGERELAVTRLAGQATSIGARNGLTVARLVAGEKNPLAAIEALKVSDPYLFGPEPRPAGADMSQGASGGTGLDAFDKHIRDKFGGPAVPQ